MNKSMGSTTGSTNYIAGWDYLYTSETLIGALAQLRLLLSVYLEVVHIQCL